MKRKPHRNSENATITFSLSKDLKKLIQESAQKDRRTVSNWLVLRIEDSLGVPPKLP